MRTMAVLIFGAFMTFSAQGETFDKPLRSIERDLGPSPDQPDFPNLHRHLSCHYFPQFMVKQLSDDGNKGALKILVIKTPLGSTPPCTLPAGQKEISVGDGWDYYWGVKKRLVILIGADGSSGGTNFDIFDAFRGRKLFKDYVLHDPTEELDFALDATGSQILRYQRVFYAKCSVAIEKSACWRKIERQTHLLHVARPKCDYSAAQGDLADPSVISYPVEVTLLSTPKRRVLSQSAKCWAAE